MGGDDNEHAGRDHCVHDARLSEHSDDADGSAHQRDEDRARGSVPVTRDGGGGGQRDGFREGLRWPVRLGPGDPGHGTIGVLLRLHCHTHTGRCASPEVRRQVHRGLRPHVHGHADPVHAHRGAHGLQAPDGFAFRRRIRRSKVASAVCPLTIAAYSTGPMANSTNGCESPNDGRHFGFFFGGDGQTVKRVCCLIPKKIFVLLEII